jgi:MFS family permease
MSATRASESSRESTSQGGKDGVNELASIETSVPPVSPTIVVDVNAHWQRNLWVVTFGSFTTIVAMTLLLPFLPLYVEQLGVKDHAAIVQWSGVAYAGAFFTAAFVAPLWGRLADRYGRKLMLIRASLGMAIAMSLIGMAQNVYQLVGLRLLVGFLGGYSSGSMTLVAAQTPKARTAWALGVLATGTMAGNLIGPLIGGALPQLIGIRNTFLAVGAIIFLTFLATTFMIREETHAVRSAARANKRGGWASVPNKAPVIAMLVTGMLLQLANMSIEPIITVYVQQIVDNPAHVTMVAGIVMSAAALGSILSAPRLGKLADRIGHWTVIVTCLLIAAVLLIPQAFVTAGWQLIALRLLMGLALGGLLPCVATVIRHNVPDTSIGSILGLSTSSQYAGQVTGPLVGGFVGGHLGMRAVFLGTSVIMAAGAAFSWLSRSKK